MKIGIVPRISNVFVPIDGRHVALLRHLSRVSLICRWFITAPKWVLICG